MNNDEPEIIDAEIVDSDNLPAVLPPPGSYESDGPIEAEGLTRTDDGRDWPHGPTPDRRCVAHKKTGEQCKNAAILGATVCRFHGGAAKHVKRAARARLENAADLMAKQLLRIALTADNESVALSAVKDALDRGGLKPPSEVVLSQGEQKPYEELFEGIAGGSRAESRKARGISDPDTYSPAPESKEERSSSSGYTRSGSRPVADEFHTDSSPATAAEAYTESAPPREARPRRVDRETHAQPPVTGADALRIAADLARQRAIESPHKKYPRP